MVSEKTWAFASMWVQIGLVILLEGLSIMMWFGSDTMVSTLILYCVIDIFPGFIGGFTFFFIILFAKIKYKKNILNFQKLARVVAHVGFIGVGIQIIIFGAGWYLLKLSSGYLIIVMGALPLLYGILGICINVQKVKKDHLWYKFTKTDIKDMSSYEYAEGPLGSLTWI